MPTRTDIEDWKSYPTTEEFFKALQAKRDTLANQIATGQCLFTSRPTEVVYARETGKIEVLDELLLKYSIWSDNNEDQTVLYESVD